MQILGGLDELAALDLAHATIGPIKPFRAWLPCEKGTAAHFRITVAIPSHMERSWRGTKMAVSARVPPHHAGTSNGTNFPELLGGVRSAFVEADGVGVSLQLPLLIRTSIIWIVRSVCNIDRTGSRDPLVYTRGVKANQVRFPYLAAGNPENH
jgi:hypothetical protein